MKDPFTRELLELAHGGHYQELAARIVREMKALGFTDRDLDLIHYFAAVAPPGAPTWQAWAVEMVLWVRKAMLSDIKMGVQE